MEARTSVVGKGCKGQGLTEYIIIVALVAIAAIGVVNIFGNQLRCQFATMVAAMAGHSDAKVEDKQPETTKEVAKKTLADYAASKQ